MERGDADEVAVRAAAALLAVMAVVLARSEETAQAVRDGLALCAQSVVPALFPFFVLSGLFISMGCAGCSRRRSAAAGRLTRRGVGISARRGRRLSRGGADGRPAPRRGALRPGGGRVPAHLLQ